MSTELLKRDPGYIVELLSGPLDGMEVVISKDSLLIGRERNLDVAIPFDGLVSRSHARLTYENGEWWLEDLGSRNGTYVGERKIVGKEKVGIESIFKIGNSEMRLRKTS